MSLIITYYAPTDTMGNTSEEDAENYRSWAFDQIEEQYPNAIVYVYDEQSNVQVMIYYAESLEQEGEIRDFINRLWDRCPWDF